MLEDVDYSGLLESAGLKSASGDLIDSPRKILFRSLNDSKILEGLNHGVVVMKELEDGYVKGTWHFAISLIDDIFCLLTAWETRNRETSAEDNADPVEAILLKRDFSQRDLTPSTTNAKLTAKKNAMASSQFGEMFPDAEALAERRSHLLRIRKEFEMRMLHRLMQIIESPSSENDDAGPKFKGYLPAEIWETILGFVMESDDHCLSPSDPSESIRIKELGKSLLHFQQLLLLLLFGLPIVTRSLNPSSELDLGTIGEEFIRGSDKLFRFVKGPKGNCENSMSEMLSSGFFKRQTMRQFEPEEIQTLATERYTFQSFVATQAVASHGRDGALAYLDVIETGAAFDAMSVATVELRIVNFGQTSATFGGCYKVANVANYSGLLLSKVLVFDSDGLLAHLAFANERLYLTEMKLGPTPSHVLTQKITQCKRCIPRLPGHFNLMNAGLGMARQDSTVHYLIWHHGEHCTTVTLISRMIRGDFDMVSELNKTTWSLNKGSKVVSQKDLVMVVDTDDKDGDGSRKRFLYKISHEGWRMLTKMEVENIVKFDPRPNCNELVVFQDLGTTTTFRLFTLSQSSSCLEETNSGCLESIDSLGEGILFRGCLFLHIGMPMLKIWGSQRIQHKNLVALDLKAEPSEDQLHHLMTVVLDASWVDGNAKSDLVDILDFAGLSHIVADLNSHGHLTFISDDLVLMDASKILCDGRIMIRFFSQDEGPVHCCGH